ncbi:valine--tRNA ligase [Thermodesulforhabdus norvegica]|uniref:Valine--tRNA ligase n=1 Tax=Thermodesulforhabdus norvegica TaxID=39841 RepID=A0A1I4UVA2_9BACT|nr:valine--tRNA ligase [Thermodesulforhabdus norvegica]SFM92947.1 valyl-tRNA synthetase [Thermodesulforhabdus norvegica]
MEPNTLPKAYDFRDVEPYWYRFWEEQGFFHADVKSPKPSFSIVIPPPNVTGQLHMGHALNNTLQDILCRYKRLKGYEVLWVPGTDHAGIATQNVVERELAKEGKTRHDIGREAFIERVWQWKEKYGNIIINQLKRLGASCDWQRQRFTMDEGLSRAVRLVFVRLYREGLIYRGKRMINWCPRCNTALANIEVEGEEVEGAFYYIRYPLEDGSGHVVVATTRPETMLGDTAVAVHPEDDRYRHLVGKHCVLPLVGRRIPIIADSYVDMELGTGALKVTPAHDFNDFELGRKHGLDFVEVIGPDGRMTELAGSAYAGVDRYECRRKVVDDLKAQGLLEKIEDIQHRVGHCYRCKSVIEPLVSLQWFVKTKPLAERAIEAVRKGRTRIIPEKWTRDYFVWLENIEDWCISRQIWWGHRIPAWYCRDCDFITVSEEDPERCGGCGSADITQDPDVLDTWFSSALWPFSTMGWPEQTPELARFYPTSVLVTGFDILFFWVARMMMMGLHFMGDVPFYDVYVHALVRDEQGQKMSKSRGNVIDPLVMMERYGTDAFRFTLAAFAVQGRDIRLSEQRIEGYRHFVNKIWNASRLVLMNLDPDAEIPDISGKPDSLVHRWILSRLQGVIEDVERALENYQFNEHAQTLYQFVWHEYCDWYLEMIKADIYGEDKEKRAIAQAVSARVLEKVLIMLHPIMPFVTEEIWQKLPQTDGSIMKASFPDLNPSLKDPEAEARMGLLQEVISGIRNIRGEMNIQPGARVDVVCRCKDDADRSLLEDYGYLIHDLARVNRLDIRDMSGDKPDVAAGAVAGSVEVYVLLKDLLDFNAELQRLEKEIQKVEKELFLTTRKLHNEDFLKKAPQDVVEKEREKSVRLGEKIKKLKDHYDRIARFAGNSRSS